MARREQEKLQPSQEKFLAVSQGKSLLAAEEEKRKTFLTNWKEITWKTWFLTANWRNPCLTIATVGPGLRVIWCLKVSDSNSVLITEITENKGTLQAERHRAMLKCKCCYFPWSFDNLHKTPSSAFLVVDLFLKAPLHTLCIHAASPVEGTSLGETESMKLWKTLLSWVRERLKQGQRSTESWRNEGWKFPYLISWFFYSSVSLHRWPQSIYLPTLLKMLPKCRTSWRSVFLPPLYCTHNWYFCYLCLLLKLSMKVFRNAWLFHPKLNCNSFFFLIKK